MTITITTRAAKGSALTHAEMDANLLALKAGAEQALQNAAEGEGLASVTRAGNNLVFTGTSGSVLGTVPLPPARLTARGTWTPGAAYATGDIASLSGMVMACVVAHTVASSATEASWWADYNAGRWVVLAGLGALSPTALTVGTGAKTLTVPSGLTFGAGMGVQIASLSGAAAMVGTVTSYNATTGILVVEVSKLTGSGSATGWRVTFTGGGSGAGGGWDDTAAVSGTAGTPYAVQASDRGKVLTGAAAYALPDISTLPMGWSVSVSDPAESYPAAVVQLGEGYEIEVQGAAVVTFVVGPGYGSGRVWQVQRWEAPEAWPQAQWGRTSYLYGHYEWDVYADSSTSTGAGLIYVGEDGSGDLLLSMQGNDALTWRAGLFVGYGPEPGQGWIGSQRGYKIGTEALALKHLTDVADVMAPTSGQVLAWGGATYSPVTPAATTDAAAGIAQAKTYTVATLPAAASHARGIVHVSDGDAGAACLAVSDGTDWLRIPLGAAVSAT